MFGQLAIGRYLQAGIGEKNVAKAWPSPAMEMKHGSKHHVINDRRYSEVDDRKVCGEPETECRH